MIHVIQSMNHSFEAFEPSPENGGHTDMITIFNRKEMAITYSMKEQARIRDILTAEGIDYIIDTKGTVMRNMGARGPAIQQFGENITASTEYRIYVLKKDYDKASHLIHT